MDKKSNMMDKLSLNVISIHLKGNVAIPKYVQSLNYERHNHRVDISVPQKKQGEVLQKALDAFGRKNVSNFTIRQDTLEHIFRRIINE